MAEFRISTREIDLSGFSTQIITLTGAMVLVAPRGRGDKPVKFRSENDVIANTIIPNPAYPSLYEAVAYTRSADMWAICAIGSGALYGGVDVVSTGVHAFPVGRINVPNFNATDTQAYVGDVLSHSGLVYSGVLTAKPYVNGLALLDGVTSITASESGGSITGAGLTGTGTLNATTGAYTFTLAATPSGVVTANYNFNNTQVSHSFFASSQYTDDLKIDIAKVSGTSYQFTMTLYRLNTQGFYETINTYNYSLIREKNSSGTSMYIDDVFQNNTYVIAKINPSFVLSSTTFASFVNTTNVLFAGGNRGATPTLANMNTAWDQFKKPNRYKASVFMDAFGTHTSYITTLISTYQPYAFGISIIPFGTSTDADGDIIYRQSLAIDNDVTALYTNFQKIQEPYQGGYVWISGVGSIGRRYVASSTSYNFESPAGVNTNNYGGQLQDWTYVDVEKDFTEISGGDTENLDNVQINPIIFDPSYGIIVKGDRTLQVSMSDTSYIGARRGYSYCIENIENSILRKLPFRINNPAIETQCRVQIENFLSPIQAAGYLREFVVVCDSTNNTDVVLSQRQFVVTVYEKIAPNIQRVLFNFVKVGQSTVISSLLP